MYNPFDLLLLFQEQEFRPYWFETATPTFLVKLLGERQLSTPKLTALETDIALLGRFDVKDIGTEALLFQTGYLTIKESERLPSGVWLYTLGFPNFEVEMSLNNAMLPVLGIEAQLAVQQRRPLLAALRDTDFSAFEAQFKSLFASIPYNWYSKNSIAEYEGYYASVFYSHLASTGLTLIAEDVSNAGRVDLTIDFDDKWFLVEFKVVEQEPTGAAMDQLKKRDYAAKYRASGRPIFLIGVTFSKKDRQIVGFVWEKWK